MNQERKDRTAEWLYIKDDQYAHINCSNCTHTVATVDYINYPDIADCVVNKLPKYCPICRMKIIKTRMIKTRFKDENFNKWSCHDNA